MKCTTETLTQEHNVVLHCQSGDDCLSFLVPEVSDGVHTVLILNFVEVQRMGKDTTVMNFVKICLVEIKIALVSIFLLHKSSVSEAEVAILGQV